MIIVATIFAAGGAGEISAGAQNLPDHSIRLVVAYPPGGPNDTQTRAGTPRDVIAKLNTAENVRLKSPEMQVAIAKLGAQARPLTPGEFGAVLAEQVRLWKAVADEAGVHLE